MPCNRPQVSFSQFTNENTYCSFCSCSLSCLVWRTKQKSATLLYAMTENRLLYRSADGSETWQNIALPATPGQFDALAVDPENSSNLYVDVSVRGKAAPGQQDNYFFRSADGGATWSETKLSGTPQLLAVDPAASNIVYAGIGGLFRSTDSGVTWSATSIKTFVAGINTDAHHNCAGTRRCSRFRASAISVSLAAGWQQIIK